MPDNPPDEPTEFRDFVLNPELFWEMEKEMAAEEARLSAAPTDLNDAEIREIMQHFLQGDFDRNAKLTLKQYGLRIVPFVLEALHDPRIRTVRYRNNSHSLDDATPLETLTDLLDPFGCAEAIPSLSPIIQHPDPTFRKHTALALGSIGADGCVAPLAEALKDPDDYVRSYALMGIRRALDAKRASATFREAIFAHIVPLLTRNEDKPTRLQRWITKTSTFVRKLFRLPVYSITALNFNTAQESPLCLLELDPEKGLATLLDQKHFHAGNEYLYRVVEAINEKKIPIEIDRIQALLNQLRDRVDDYFVRRACDELIAASARGSRPKAEALIREVQTWGNSEILEAATKAQNILMGVEDALGFVLNRLEKVGFKRLTKPQKVYYCVWQLNVEVRNGGFSQYFFNSFGKYAKLTIKALRKLGAAETATIVEQAVAIFGSSGPAQNRDERQEQLASVFASNEINLSNLDDQFYENNDDLSLKLTELVKQYPRHFQPRRPTAS